MSYYQSFEGRIRASGKGRGNYTPSNKEITPQVSNLILHAMYIYHHYYIQDSVCVSVSLCVTDVTHFSNVYSGNGATPYPVTRTLGTSLLTVGAEL